MPRSSGRLLAEGRADPAAWRALLTITLTNAGFALGLGAVMKALDFLPAPGGFFLGPLLFFQPLGAWLSSKRIAGMVALPWPVFARRLSVLSAGACLFAAAALPLAIWLSDFAPTSGPTELAWPWSLGLFVLFVGPFLASWGALDLAAFLRVTAADLRQEIVYLAALFGLLLGLLVHNTLPWIGLFPALAAGAALALCGRLVDAGPGRVRLLAWPLVLLGVSGALAAFDADTAVLFGLNRHTRQTHARPLYSAWDKHSGLVVIGETRDRPRALVGFYNNRSYWSLRQGESSSGWDGAEVPLRLAPRELPAAFLAAGGGYLASLAATAGLESTLDLVEINETVVNALHGPLKGEWLERMPGPPARPVLHAAEGRAFMRTATGSYGMIYVDTSRLHSGGTNLLTPTLLLYTWEAAATYGARLAPEGLLVFRWRSGLAVPELLRASHPPDLAMGLAASMRRAGLYPATYVAGSRLDRSVFVMALGRPRPWTAQERAQLVALRAQAGESGARMLRFWVPGEELPAAPSDDLPTSWLVQPVSQGTRIAMVAAAAVSILLLLAFGSGPSVAPFLVGLNYQAVQTALVFRLFWELASPMSAFYLGAVLFLSLAATGAMVRGRFQTPLVKLPLAAVGVGLCAAGLLLPSNGVLFGGLGVLSLLCGDYFLTIFKGDAAARGRILLLDGLGAALGTLLALVVPFAFGMNAFLWVAVGAAALTASGVARGGARGP